MTTYRTIKELVLDSYDSAGSVPSYVSLTALVREHFPESRWQKSHYTWYKSQIRRGLLSPTPGAIQRIDDAGLGEVDREVDESIEVRVSMERDLQSYLAANIEMLEPGLSVATGGVEYTTEAGRIDILATNGNEELIVVELKAGTAGDAALGQLLGYMGCLHGDSRTKGAIRGILVAAAFDLRVTFAARSLENVQLFKYKMNFDFCNVT